MEPAWKLSGQAPESRWLVTGLWSCEAVGIVGGEPKCCKSFLALDLAAGVLIDPVQPDERIEDQEFRLQVRDGALERVTVGG